MFFFSLQKASVIFIKSKYGIIVYLNKWGDTVGFYRKKTKLKFINQMPLSDWFVLVWQLKYTEEFSQSNGKGSFPAMITPGYQAAKQANTLASNVC